MILCSACGTPYHPSTGHIHSDKTLLCGPCARDFSKWVSGQTRRRWGKVRFYDHAMAPKYAKDIVASGPEWLESSLIMLCRSGSHAYGTNTESSDEDFRGICVPPREYWIGFQNNFDQWVSTEPDAQVYGLRKFLNLAVNNNPNVLELLFVDPLDEIIVSTSWYELQNIRDKFLSKKCRHTFSGYAMSQLKRIRAHRSWLLDPPKKKPERSDFGLPETSTIPRDERMEIDAAIQQKIDTWMGLDMTGLDEGQRISLGNQLSSYVSSLARVAGKSEDELTFLAAAEELNITDQVLAVIRKERAYKSALNHWNQYNNWAQSRNAARAELEMKFGYDTKHGMHLVRLLRMCEEILEGKGVLVKRPDAEELLAIRNGAWSYDTLIEWAEKQDARMQDLYKTSTLRNSPEVKDIDIVCQKIVERRISL